MNKEHWHLLENYQHLMRDFEKMSARWLTEEWDRESEQFPSWLRTKLFQLHLKHLPETPEKLGKSICLNLLHEHKHDITLANEI